MNLSSGQCDGVFTSSVIPSHEVRQGHTSTKPHGVNISAHFRMRLGAFAGDIRQHLLLDIFHPSGNGQCNRRVGAGNKLLNT